MVLTRINTGDDPFLAPRDAGEVAADAVMRTFILDAAPPAVVYRQNGGSYALVIPSRRGARLLTVPAANEADFTFHGNADADGEQLADFVATAIAESAADHVRLPLLSEAQAAWLRHRLASRLPDWIWSASLAAVAPFAAGTMRQTDRLRRAMARAEREGLAFNCGRSINRQELELVHVKRWGPGNRGTSFFHLLEALLSAGCAELITARNHDGALIAAQLDILGTFTRHYYYSVSDTDRVKGCGTSVLGASWIRFTADGHQTVYSFGRGSERYKYQYANGHRAFFELRGFFAPACSQSGFGIV
jgi:Acetyltransferase (GNAT) domain